MGYYGVDASTGALIQPMSITNQPTVYSNLQANGTYYSESATNLSANALFTGSAHDSGSASGAYHRFRVIAMASAGYGHGTVIFEQSTDGVTFRETNRYAVPSDGQYYTYDVTWNMRYIRVKFQNGATAQTAFWLQSYGVRTDGPIDLSISPTFIHSVTALAASGSFTGVTLDTGASNAYVNHRAVVYADQAGTLYLEQSRDGSTWRTTTTQAVTAGTAAIVSESLVHRYARVRFVNGATAQATFELASTLVHV